MGPGVPGTVYTIPVRMPEMYILFQELRNHHPGSPLTALGDDGKVAGVLQRARLSKVYFLFVIPAQAGIQAHGQGIRRILVPETPPWIPDNNLRG